MRVMLRSKPVFVVACVSLAILLFAAVRFVSFIIWSDRIGDDLARLALADTRLPVSLTVFGRSVDTVSAQLSFFTADGDRTGTIERSWAGWEIKIDCIMIKAGSGWLAFPFLMYTDASPRGSGVDLIRYYDRDGFPAIYDSTRLSSTERNAIRRVFALVRTELWMPAFLGSLSHRTIGIRSFEPGVGYSLFVGRDGKLQIKSN